MKETKICGIIRNKCPRCRKGNFFIDNNPYHIKRFDKMHKACSCCGLNYEFETGFYYGAMYVSYGLNVGLGIMLYVLTAVMLGLNPVTCFLPVFSLLVLLLLPVTYRISRLMWISLFVKSRISENS